MVRHRKTQGQADRNAGISADISARIGMLIGGWAVPAGIGVGVGVALGAARTSSVPLSRWRLEESGQARSDVGTWLRVRAKIGMMFSE